MRGIETERDRDRERDREREREINREKENGRDSGTRRRRQRVEIVELEAELFKDFPTECAGGESGTKCLIWGLATPVVARKPPLLCSHLPRLWANFAVTSVFMTLYPLFERFDGL